jgi:hypothetical protein
MICRICKGYHTHDDRKGRLLKYSTRHYAHFTCWMEKHGADGFKSLSAWKLKQFPVLPASKLGLLKALEDAVRSAEEREAQTLPETPRQRANRLLRRLDARIDFLRVREQELQTAIEKNKTGKPQVDQVGSIAVESPAADADIIDGWQHNMDKVRASIADYEEIKTIVKQALGVA